MPSTLKARIAEYSGARRQRKQLLSATREKYRIRLRHFAGPAMHAEVLDHPIRLAHITDQHVGLVTPEKVQMEAVAIANRQEPDIVVLTGDFVCHSHAYLDQLVQVVEAFDAPVFCVMGNHDHWAGADDVRAALRRGGAEILDNANTVVTVGGQQLQLVGLDDAYTGHADRARAIKGMRRDLPTIGLSHIAEEADGLWDAGIPLVLSGHTHGGQLSVARLHELALGKLMKHRFIHGLYGARSGPDAQGAVYVGAGIGAGVMPLRIGDRGGREVTMFDLGEFPGFIEEHHDEQSYHPRPDDHDEEAHRERAHAKFQKRRARKASNGKK